jgi:hypothetical protein
MDRNEAINTIEALYPADSDYPDSRETGKMLLEQAESEVNGWRTKPTEVLIRYAELCMAEDNRQTRKLESDLVKRGLYR